MPSRVEHNRQHSKGIEPVRQARGTGDMLGMHSSQDKAEECGAVQPPQEESSPGERVFLNMSSMRTPAGVAAVPSANWRIMVDECTKFKVSHFFHRKDQMAEETCKLLKAWKGLAPRLSGLDNAGENKLFDQEQEQGLAVGIADGVYPKAYATA